MQNIKPSDLTKLEAFGLSLAVSRENDSHPDPVATGNPAPSVPPSEAEKSVGLANSSERSPANNF
jgi:hypothetical protein